MSSYATFASAWRMGQPMFELFETREEFAPRVTLPIGAWRDYVASGKNTLYGSGGVIPGGTVSLPGGVGGGAVYAGHVRQG
jgi:hypothetical protein